MCSGAVLAEPLVVLGVVVLVVGVSEGVGVTEGVGVGFAVELFVGVIVVL